MSAHMEHKFLYILAQSGRYIHIPSFLDFFVINFPIVFFPCTWPPGKTTGYSLWIHIDLYQLFLFLGNMNNQVYTYEYLSYFLCNLFVPLGLAWNWSHIYHFCLIMKAGLYIQLYGLMSQTIPSSLWPAQVACMETWWPMVRCSVSTEAQCQA